MSYHIYGYNTFFKEIVTFRSMHCINTDLLCLSRLKFTISRLIIAMSGVIKKYRSSLFKFI